METSAGGVRPRTISGRIELNEKKEIMIEGLTIGIQEKLVFIWGEKINTSNGSEGRAKKLGGRYCRLVGLTGLGGGGEEKDR